jgi:hypothetical protein
VGRALRSACYLGDDLGDLAAFRALDQLATQGISTARIAVRSDETIMARRVVGARNAHI